MFFILMRELGADLLVLVGKQLERETHLRLEIVVGLEAVARDAVDFGAGLAELRVQVPEVRAFGGAARGIVLGIEVQHQHFGLGIGQPESLAARALQGEVPNRLGAHQWCFALGLAL
jgi:hypothetical protein